MSCLGGLFIYQVAVGDSGDFYLLLPTDVSVGDEIGYGAYRCTSRCWTWHRCLPLSLGGKFGTGANRYTYCCFGTISIMHRLWSVEVITHSSSFSVSYLWSSERTRCGKLTRRLWGKVKVTLVQALRLCTSRTVHRGSRGIALPFHDHGTRREWGVRVTPRPLFTAGKTQYPLYRRLGQPQGRSGQVRKISPPPTFDPQTVQPVASRYTDWATGPRRLWNNTEINLKNTECKGLICLLIGSLEVIVSIVVA